jgi:cbb3-type cytochrome oxidase maturation protein
VSTLAITIPATLLLAAVLLALVVRAARRGEFDDWEGPAFRHFLDADDCPERDRLREDAPLPARGSSEGEKS